MTHIPVRHPSGDLRSSKSAILPICQRFGSALNLNVRLQMLFLDGVYIERHEKPRFRRISAPVKTALEVLVRQISQRVGRHLERHGLLERDIESSRLTLDSNPDVIRQILHHLDKRKTPQQRPPARRPPGLFD